MRPRLALSGGIFAGIAEWGHDRKRKFWLIILILRRMTCALRAPMARVSVGLNASNLWRHEVRGERAIATASRP